MTNLEASVIIIVRNGAATIRRQLDALSAQVDAPPFEVLVVDNGSTDGTADVVRQWMTGGIGAATRAAVIDASERPGIPFARNTGALAAEGRLILWCDADDVVRPQWVASFCANVRRGAAGGQSFARHPDGRPEPTFIPEGLITTRYLPFASNSNFAIERTVFFDVGGYDESLPRYGAEDLELCWRLQEAGHELSYVAEAEVDYTISSHGVRVRKEILSSQARMAAQLRHPLAFGDQQPTFVRAAARLLATAARFPWRMVRPAPYSRARRGRHVLEQVGELMGLWSFAVRGRPAQLVQARPAGGPAGDDIPLSVVIIVRNGARTIERQLDALAAQIDAPRFEVVVSDNGSTDDTVAVVQRWHQRGTGAIGRLIVTDAGAKAGIPYARNVGAKTAAGRVLAFCDADDAVHERWVKAYAEGLTDGIGGGRIVAWRDGLRDESSIPSGLTRTPYLPHVSGCNWAITREAFFNIGGFDESLPVYGCDDVDISWRAQEHGYPITYVPEAVVDFTITTSGAQAAKKTFRAAQARMAVALRYPRSFGDQRPTLRSAAATAAEETLLLPVRLLRPPAALPRSRVLRSCVVAWGRLVGYWTYGVRKKPAQYIVR